MGIGPYLVGVAFWAFVAVAAVAGVVGGYKRRRIELEPLRTAIERGQQLDPAIVDRFMAATEQGRIDPLHLRIGGIITIAAGAGFVPLAFFISRVAPPALYPILGAATLAVCVGIGLLIAARAVEQHQRGQQVHGRNESAPGRPRS